MGVTRDCKSSDLLESSGKLNWVKVGVNRHSAHTAALMCVAMSCLQARRLIHREVSSSAGKSREVYFLRWVPRRGTLLQGETSVRKGSTLKGLSQNTCNVYQVTEREKP